MRYDPRELIEMVFDGATARHVVDGLIGEAEEDYSELWKKLASLKGKALLDWIAKQPGFKVKGEKSGFVKLPKGGEQRFDMTNPKKEKVANANLRARAFEQIVKPKAGSKIWSIMAQMRKEHGGF